jgi:hypothetical protein
MKFWSLLLMIAVGGSHAWGQGGPPFRTDDPDTPGNKHWEINFGWIADRNPAAGAYQVPDFDINYGLGDRIQLKYEIPIAIEEQRPLPTSPAFPQGQEGLVLAGLGESLLGVKYRYYEHHPGDSWFSGFGLGLKPEAKASGEDEAEKPVNLSFGTYPQLYLNNPTRSVARGLVASGPNFYLPVEIAGRIGPIRYNADAGYNFGNRNLPQSWNRGFIVGHEFSESTEAYIELYDLQGANRLPAGRGVGQFATGIPKSRETTIGLGGRQALNKTRTLNLLLMGGRSFQTVSATNTQPSWIAYVGFQVLFGPKEPENEQVRPTLPNEGGK